MSSNVGKAMRNLVIAILILNIGFVACTYSIPGIESPAIDPKLADAFQNRLDNWLESNDLTGATMAVKVLGEGVWVGGSGFADYEAQTLMPPDARFRIGSITKTFVSVVVLQLAQEGALSLEDPLVLYVPDYPYADKVTIRNLLNHTSGVIDYTAHRAKLLQDSDKIWRPEEIIALIEEERLKFEPGSLCEYSNSNYILLGMVVEAITGAPFHDELHARILEPLNLEDTYLAGVEQIPGKLARSHTWNKEVRGDLTVAAETSAWTAGGMVSSAEDILRFVSALFESEDLLKESYREAMLDLVEVDGQIPKGGGWDLRYGLGIMQIETPDGIILSHNGLTEGYTSLFIFSPEKGVTFTVLINSKEIDAPPLGFSLYRDLIDLLEED